MIPTNPLKNKALGKEWKSHLPNRPVVPEDYESDDESDRRDENNESDCSGNVDVEGELLSDFNQEII